MVLDKFFDIVFGWSIGLNHIFGIGFIAFVFTLLVTLIYKYMTDQDSMRNIKGELKEIQKQIKESKHDSKRLMELQKNAMEKNMKYMMHSFKPMLVTFIPIILIFGWLRNEYSEIGGVLFGLSWIWSYVIFSIIFSIALRKLLKVY